MQKQLYYNQTETELFNNKMLEQILKEVSMNNATLVGIKRRGFYIAKNIYKTINNSNIDFGYLDINFYSDELTQNYDFPKVKELNIKSDIRNKTIIIIDDVLHTGQTMWCAINEILRLGNPTKIVSVVMIDRIDLRMMPIKADIFGSQISLNSNEVIHVHIPEVDGESCVTLSSMT